MQKAIQFKLNGEGKNLLVSPDRMLLWVLRSDLELTGTKHSCGEGFCGSCTVLVNNRAVLSCQTPVRNVAGKEVLTVEGLEKKGTLDPIQAAFLEHNALQCGFCTPGMILKTYELLINNPDPTTQEIIEALEGNLCRCGSYGRIIQAVHSAARAAKGMRP